MQVHKAVITAASRASRHLPLQTLVDRDGESRTVLAILLREIAAASIERVCVVVHPGDEEAYAEAVSDPARPVVFIPQENPRGYGDAILRAKNFIADEPFLHLVGDHLYVGGHCAATLVKMAEAEQCAVSAVRATHESLLSSFGAVGANLFAGTFNSGVFRSADQGESWTAVNTGLPPNASISSIAAVGPNLFAATFNSGVFHSTDQGGSWTAINVGLTDLRVRTFAVLEGRLFAGTLGSGVFVTDVTQ